MRAVLAVVVVQLVALAGCGQRVEALQLVEIKRADLVTAMARLAHDETHQRRPTAERGVR
jgi:hypothetical protein